tara:strand:+ start:127 stop:462 length:336 start_codon:yes stop_codon:yes gene_type:complete
MHPESRLDALRTNRVRSDRDRSIAETVARAREKYARIVRDGDDVAGAWDRTVPERFRGTAAVVGCKGGVLTIRCRSASDRYALDRWLRAGGEQAVRDAARAAVKRVKLVLR